MPSRCCLANPPPRTPPHPCQTTHSLRIASQIACGDGRGAQVITCHFEGQEADLFVAKIYDPLYYKWSDFEITYLADRQYSCEAAAFERLHSVKKDVDKMRQPGVREVLERSIPSYHGCWTWETTLLDGQHRDVRMILMSHVPYPSLSSIIERGVAGKIPAESRMQLLARAFEIYCWLEFFGVRQNDFAPRNIMVSPDQEQAVLLDFSHSIVKGLPNSRWMAHVESTPNLPRSPIELFRASCGNNMGDWIPNELQAKDAQYRWFMKQWGNSEGFAPVSPEVMRRLDKGDSKA